MHFTLPFSPVELENFVLRVGQPRRGTRGPGRPESAPLKEFGGKLYGAVFQDEVRDTLLSSLNQTRKRGVGMRLRLRLTDTPELAELPWEFLYDPRLNRFLAQSRRTPLVRYLDLPDPPHPLAVAGPLRLLVMIASPNDCPPLDVEQEWSLLDGALAQQQAEGRVIVERLPANMSTLRRRLRREEFHVFHFIGHGRYRSDWGDGVVVMEDRDGRSHEVTGEELGGLLNEYDSTRLAVLNACEGARSDASDPFAGMAQSLIQQGLPAVVAMQFEITDDGAIIFAHELYGAIADGYPLEAALAEARGAIRDEGNPTEWGTPVLYSRAPDGRLFDVAAQGRISDADRSAQVSWQRVREEPPGLGADDQRHQHGPAASSGESEPVISEDDVLIPIAGLLYVHEDHGFIHTTGYLPGPNDVSVSLSQVRRHRLRRGDVIEGAVRQASKDKRQGKFNALARLDKVNGLDPEQSRSRPEFTKLVPLYPQERFRLETDPSTIATRIIDLIAPIGKGQRGLIVSPPRAGITTILQAITNAIAKNNPECHLMMVLLGERPEDITDMQRSVRGEVIYSRMNGTETDHLSVADLAIERAKRLAELGHDVVVMLDSLTRLGRAHELATSDSNRRAPGAVDPAAFAAPDRVLGAACNIERGGSVTVLATLLTETLSRADEVIFEEFKGTGNMEIRLRRDLADKRIFPAIDVDASGTRKEELLMPPEELKITWQLRRVLHALEPQQALEVLIERMKETKSNAEFLLQVQKTAASS